MLSDRLIAELRAVLQTQNHILRELDAAVSDIEAKLADVASQAEQIRELERIMDELEASVALLDEDDLSDFDPDEILALYKRRRVAVANSLVKIGFKDWDSFVRKCQIYALQQKLDPLAPYEALLTDADLKRLRNESYDAQFEWDKWDYIFVGASGVLAALTDYLLVQIPKHPNILNNGEFNLTAWLKQYDTKMSNDWFAQWAQHLSDTCKVPYDATSFAGSAGVERIPGMYPGSHRFQSLGHDPGRTHLNLYQAPTWYSGINTLTEKKISHLTLSNEAEAQNYHC